MSSSETLASDITSEAIVFRNCTQSELKGIFVSCFIGSLLAGMAICGYVFGNVLFGFLLGVILTIATFFSSINYLGRIKNKAPAGQYGLQIDAFLCKYQLKKMKTFSHHGEMSIGRTKPLHYIRESRS